MVSAAVFTLSAACVLADSVKLKDGTVIEGRVTANTADSVTIEYSPGKGIKDTKTIKKDEIAELKVQSEDEVEAVAIKKLVPTADLTSPTQYAALLARAKPFLEKFKTSKFLPEVQAVLKTLEDEKGKVETGWQKLDGNWITPEESVWNSYNIEARVLRKQMQQDLEKKDVKGALDKMARLKNDFPASGAFVEAIDAYEKLLTDYQKELVRMAAEHPQLQKDLDAQRKTLDKAGVEALNQDLKNQEEAIKKKQVEEKQKKIPLPSIWKYDIRSIEDGQKAVLKELEDLKKLDRDKHAKAAKFVADGLEAVNKGNPGAAFANLSQAATLFSSDARLRAMRDQQKKAADEAAKNPVIAPMPNPGPTESAGQGTPEKPAGSAATSTPATQSGKPAVPAAGTATTKPTPAKPAPGTTPKPSPAPSDAPPAETDLTEYLLPAAGVLVLLGAVFAFLKKRKQKMDEETE